MDVIDHNTSAIRFYEKNEFSCLRKQRNHYELFDEKVYDSLLFYKMIGKRVEA